MLKIKDNVDLKELEKYGFIQNSLVKNTYYTEEFYKADEDNECFDNYKFEFIVNPYKPSVSNELIGCFNARDDEIDERINLDILYDLIKANLVEKVDE